MQSELKKFSRLRRSQKQQQAVYRGKSRGKLVESVRLVRENHIKIVAAFSSSKDATNPVQMDRHVVVQIGIVWRPSASTAPKSTSGFGVAFIDACAHWMSDFAADANIQR